MPTRHERREAAIERMADHVLSEGLAGATLRPLAAAVGISDRMLLYYFSDKDELLAAVLDRIAARLLGVLEASIPATPSLPFPVLLQRVWAVLSSEGLRPYMDVWLDLVSCASRGLQPHRDAASRIADGYLAWVEGRLEPADDGAAPTSAPLVLAAVGGMYILEAIGRPAIAGDALAELAPPHSAAGRG